MSNLLYCVFISYYNTKSVIICLGITALVCLIITIFSFQTKVRIYKHIFQSCNNFFFDMYNFDAKSHKCFFTVWHYFLPRRSVSFLCNLVHLWTCPGLRIALWICKFCSCHGSFTFMHSYTLIQMLIFKRIKKGYLMRIYFVFLCTFLSNRFHGCRLCMLLWELYCSAWYNISPMLI